jgi:DNA topoisomerase-1
MNHKKLIIVESPNKIKKIQSLVGETYKVMASIGHIRRRL